MGLILGPQKRQEIDKNVEIQPVKLIHFLSKIVYIKTHVDVSAENITTLRLCEYTHSTGHVELRRRQRLMSSVLSTSVHNHHNSKVNTDCNFE